MASSSDDDCVILFCTNPNPIETETAGEKEILISTRDIHSWDFPTILSFQTVKVQAHRNRLIEQASDFHGLFSGSFSESCLDSISVKWKVDAFLHILKHIYGCPLNVTSNKFLPLYEGSLFFGVETLLLKCNRWFSEVSSSHEFGSPQIQLDDLIEIWKFGLEHASEVIPETCTSYLARNFMWAMSSKFFEDVPYDMLLSCVKHPELTIDSEMHLADALVHWLETNIEILESERKAESNCSHILKQIRPSLLPLWFAAGKRNSCHFCEVAEESVDSIFRLTNIPLVSSLNVLGYQELNHLRIRLTEYSKRVNLSGCPQITSAIILLSVLHSSYMIEPMLRKSVNKFLINPEHPMRYKPAVPQGLLQTLSFEAVQEVDFSKCQRLHVEDAIECFCNSFPSLKILRAAYLLNINTTSFLKLVQKCPLVSEIDLTVDITPLIPALVSTESSSSAMTPPISEKPFSVKHRAGDVISLYEYGSPLSNIRKLTLEGRTDVCDLDLMYISKICVSLYHLNLKGCISVTDDGISDVIRRCLKLNSIVVCNTSFGKNSVLALSSAIPNIGDLTAVHSGKKHLNSLVSNFQVLHMGGCKGINESSLLELMSQTQHVNSLCLRDTDLVDHALYKFSGSCLEMLDVSNTMISGAALAYIIRRNPGLKCLKARGCRNLIQGENNSKERDYGSPCSREALLIELGKLFMLDEIAIGWGFSCFSLKSLEPAMTSLRTITIGLGGSISEDALRQLPATCPMIESIVLHFQVISDSFLVNIAVSLRNLRVLALCYCLGNISILSFRFSMQNLRILRLERVTPWMTNNDLVILTQSCTNLVELSLLGCPLLKSDSQNIISLGWPGLVSIHLEDCGEVTANGVSSLLDCIALEDLVLRHNGGGLQRNFIFHAASKMPMLRKLSLDLCDASEGGYDIPNYVDRCSLSTLKIARCKSWKCAFNLPLLETHRRSVHRDTLVLVWNSRDLVTTVVKERL